MLLIRSHLDAYKLKNNDLIFSTATSHSMIKIELNKDGSNTMIFDTENIAIYLNSLPVVSNLPNAYRQWQPALNGRTKKTGNGCRQ